MKMIKTSCGYMTAQEWAMICRVSKQEEHQKKKVEKNSDRHGGVVICDETKQTAESIR
ncbi:hypothetical protein [Lacticaseibacillus baoqingensis]|uniref:hypothetical protein n=1 Tax=Lacticaseibacillus baoqingensis TaxID=2486013 RepID=UPI0013DE2F20|nr:hypothetical protein [Lacticaseibacillus baoqingensis]